MAGFTTNFVRRELIITLKSHNNNFSSVVFTLLRCVYGCLWPACACVRVCAYTKPRQQKFRTMNWAHLASPIRGELGYAHWPQLGYNLRPRAHEFKLPLKDDRNFVPRLLFKDMY